MNTTTMKKLPKVDEKLFDRAQELMSKYATLNQQRNDLVGTIVEELKGLDEGMKQTQQELLTIGEATKHLFGTDGNLVFDEGYLHIASQAKVMVNEKKFDVKEFARVKPDYIDIELKLAPIKKAWLNKDERKELTMLGVTVDTTEKVQVILNKPKP